MKEITTEGVAQIPNTVDVKTDPEVDQKTFENSSDKLRMDYDVSRNKARYERIPRSGQGADVEHHRRAAGLRRRFVEGVNTEQDGWKSIPKSLIETVKQVMKKTIPVPEPEDGFEGLKGKHPLIDVGNKPKNPKVTE